MAYKYALLDPNVSESARRYNDTILGPKTLGFEVTSISFARRCGKGNIDPQHTQGRSSSCIEEALTYPLPPDGTIFVTERRDKDSVGGMAVMTLRSLRQTDKIDKILVAMVGALDRHGASEAFELYPELFEFKSEVITTDALNIIAMSDSDLWPDLESRVRDTMKVLCGEMPKEQLDQILAMKDRKRSYFAPTMYDEIAFISAPGEYSKAREWAIKKHQIVVVEDIGYTQVLGKIKEFRRVTVARQSVAPLNRDLFEKRINEAEARSRGISLQELERRNLKWGGTQNIVSSPNGKGRSTELPISEILQVAHSCIISKKVSSTNK